MPPLLWLLYIYIYRVRVHAILLHPSSLSCSSSSLRDVSLHENLLHLNPSSLTLRKFRHSTVVTGLGFGLSFASRSLRRMSASSGRMDMESLGFAGGVCVSEVRDFEGYVESYKTLGVVDDDVMCEMWAGEAGIEGLEEGKLGGQGKGDISLGERDDLKELLPKSKYQVSDCVVKRCGIDDVCVKSDAGLENSGHEITVGMKDELKSINLTVELPPFGIESKCADKVEEKAQKDAKKVKSRAHAFGISDLVWGKVRNHPWWPGQVFDASAASDEAKKHFTKKGFLIAYFGDQTFAWNEVGAIKSFRKNFSQLEKKSDSEDFCYAINCALDELSRRVECELACGCVPVAVYNKFRAQRIVNAGVRKKSSERDGGDRVWKKETLFDPGKSVEYLKKIAVSPPLAQADRLEFVTEKACLSAFFRWKGYNHLPEFNMIHGLYEDGEDVPMLGEENHSGELVEVVGSQDDPVKTAKRKGKDGCPSGSKKTKKSLQTPMDNKQTDKSSDGIGSSEGKVENIPLSSLLRMKREARGVISDDSTKSITPRLNPETKPLFGVGDRIMKVISKIGKSMPSQEHHRVTYQEKIDFSQGSIDLVIQQASPNELLSVLSLLAMKSSNPHDMLVPVLSFFSKFRDSICLEKQQGISLEQLLNSQYRIDFSKYLHETEVEFGTAAKETVETANSNEEEGEGNPTTLILKFTNSDSIPTEETLNKIFKRYGPLKESETQVFTKVSNRAKVVFKKQSDAEAAFSSTGKYTIFGPSLVSYRLNYVQTKPSKTSYRAKKRTKKAE